MGVRPGIPILTALPLLGRCRPAQLAALNDSADLARVGPEEPLMAGGAPLDQFVMLLGGYVAETQLRQGRQVCTNVLGPSGPIGLAPALLGLPSPTGARTITSVRLLLIPVAPLRALMRAEPAASLPFLDHALAELHAATQEARRLKLLSAAQRLALALLGFVPDPTMTPARFVLPYEMRFLAARVGCSQENLSRAFAALRRLGVDSQRGSVVMRDVPGLRAFAGLDQPPA